MENSGNIKWNQQEHMQLPEINEINAGDVIPSYQYSNKPGRHRKSRKAQQASGRNLNLWSNHATTHVHRIGGIQKFMDNSPNSKEITSYKTASTDRKLVCISWTVVQIQETKGRIGHLVKMQIALGNLASLEHFFGRVGTEGIWGTSMEIQKDLLKLKIRSWSVPLPSPSTKNTRWQTV